MDHYVVSTGTITYATKGRDILRESGFKAYVERRLSTKNHKGCGYVIIVSGEINKIKSVLNSAGVKILDITVEGQS